jgi:hypothetical protein
MMTYLILKGWDVGPAGAGGGRREGGGGRSLTVQQNASFLVLEDGVSSCKIIRLI